MKVCEAIEKLKTFPRDAELMVPDLGVGGSVEVVEFEEVKDINGKTVRIDVVGIIVD